MFLEKFHCESANLNFKANFLKICKMLVATFFLQISLFVQTETWLEYSLD